ncbi:coiled-coil domain-containing protein [Marinobacterium weihaiense]|uniref:Uncharacterized protein n=1 Tax=Marinobacterium weihaiense TaxID=2851016 RepID=A0ABS6M7X4_9GAMM|nr:hypothetical protein [Marinobacterium weihaiense]MBV0932373.1 hypothetical protein [Marinobacterium weihaiense]
MNAIIDKLFSSKKSPKAVADWAARIEELRQAELALSEEHSELQTRFSRAEALLRNAEERHSVYVSMPASGSRRFSPDPQVAQQRADEVTSCRVELEQANAAYTPVQQKMQQIRAELKQLHGNPPKATKADLKAVRAEVDGIAGKIESIQKAQEAATDPEQEAATAQLRGQVEEATATRDLIAADVGLGEATEADLQKAQKALELLKSKLDKVAAEEEMMKARNRGYELRIQQLEAELHAAKELLKQMVENYADEVYAEAAKRAVDAFDQLKEAFLDMKAADLISYEQGHRKTKSWSAESVSIEFGNCHVDPKGITEKCFRPKGEVISDRKVKHLAAAGLA